MIASLSIKHKISNNSPNYLIFSSANHNSTRSSANRSTHEPYPSAQSANDETDKSQPKTFKIRTFGSKAITAKQPRIEGKRITQEVINSIKEDSQIRILKCNYNNRRPSIQLSKQPTNQRSHRSKKETGSTESAIFRSIELKQKQEKYQMNFQYFDLSSYAQLSHRPHVWINNERPIHQNRPQNVVIFSVNLINLDPKKINKPRQKSYYSQRSVECETQSSFSIDAQAILRNICGRSDRSFINDCRVYFKVSNNSQMNDLRQFLMNNQLTNFDGIIDIRGKVTDTFTFYSINQIVSEGERLIILEEQQAISNEVPLITGLQTIFITLTGKNLTYSNVNKTIKILKDVSIEKSIKSRYSYGDSSKKSTHQHEEKENMHPNIQLMFKKTPSRSQKQSKLASNRKNLRDRATLYTNTLLKAFPFKLDWSVLASKLQQINQMKNIRQQMKQSRGNNRNNANPLPSLERSQKSRTRIKSTDSRIESTVNHAGYSIQLQGDFKEKLMKYVKIIDSERTSQYGSKQNKYKERFDNREDDLEDLTYNLTTRIKSKTPFQIVGDLTRNNAHIARQVQKHINRVNQVRKILQKPENNVLFVEPLDEKFIYTFQL